MINIFKKSCPLCNKRFEVELPPIVHVCTIPNPIELQFCPLFENVEMHLRLDFLVVNTSRKTGIYPQDNFYCHLLKVSDWDKSDACIKSFSFNIPEHVSDDTFLGLLAIN